MNHQTPAGIEGKVVAITGASRGIMIISPGFVQANFAESASNPEVRAQITASMDSCGIPPGAIARSIAFAIKQPAMLT